MEQIKFPFSRNLPLKRLVADALVDIERLGYGRRSTRRYRAVWEHLIAFADRNKHGDEFSEELVARFLEEYCVGDEELGPGEGWRRHVVWEVKALADFAKDGHIERAFTEVEAIQLVPAMQGTLRDYQQYCKDRLHLRPTTLERHERTLPRENSRAARARVARRNQSRSGAMWQERKVNENCRYRKRHDILR